MGWERPNVFAPSPADARIEYAWGRQNWHPWSAAEQRATRGAVAVFDQTSFSKYVVSGPGALAALQWVCANDVDVAVGTAVYTPMLNRRGTYESDLTVTRTAADAFLLVSSSATTVRDQDWIRRNVPDGLEVDVRDVTPSYAVLGVMGPRSRELLARLTDADLGEDGFPFATSRLLELGGTEVRATRMTYVGELGWELMVPVDAAAGVYDAVVDAGADLGVTNAGYYAIESLRLEKGFRAFGRELTPDYTPVEAGLVFATALDKLDARGSRSTSWAAGRSPRTATACAPVDTRRRLVSLVVRDTGADAVGRRAGPARRRAGRPGDERGLGRDGRGVRGAGLRPA